MSVPETVEVVDEETALVPYQPPPAPTTLFGTDQPREVIARASLTATALSEVIKAQGLATQIQGRPHVRVEGWSLLGTMLGVFPVCVWTRKLENGWEARVEARTLAGAVVGAAEAECLRSENTWKTRDDYALRSMAQTRATSKALRQPLGFVMTLAGYDPTPAEEMPVADPPAPRPAATPAPTATDAQRTRLTELGASLTTKGQLNDEQQRKLAASIADPEYTQQKASELLAHLEGLDKLPVDG